MQATNTKYINTENSDFYLIKINKNKKKNLTPTCDKTPLSNKTNFDNPDPVPLVFLNLELLSA